MSEFQETSVDVSRVENVWAAQQDGTLWVPETDLEIPSADPERVGLAEAEVLADDPELTDADALAIIWRKELPEGR